jgi:hypothetical protein
MPETITVGLSSLIGELSLIDGLARVCTATTDLRCAVLSRQALGSSAGRPATAPADVCRGAARGGAAATSDKLRLHGQLVKALQLEVEPDGVQEKPPHLRRGRLNFEPAISCAHHQQHLFPPSLRSLGQRASNAGRLARRYVLGRLLGRDTKWPGAVLSPP